MEIIAIPVAVRLGSGWWRGVAGGGCIQGHPLAIFLQLDAHLLDLCAEASIFMVCGFGSFLEVFDLGLQVLQVTFFALTESSLSGSVLGLAFLERSTLVLH